MASSEVVQENQELRARMESVEAITGKNEFDLAAVAKKMGVRLVTNPDLEKEISRLENKLRDLEERRKQREQERREAEAAQREAEAAIEAGRTAAATTLLRGTKTMAEEERYATVGEQPSEVEEDLTSEETLEPNVEAAEEDRVAAEAMRKESKFASDVEKNLTFAMKGFNLASEVAMPQLEMKSGKILHVQNGDVLGTMFRVAAEATLTETTMQPPWKRPHTFVGGPEKTKRSLVKPPNTLVCVPEMINRPPAKPPNIGALWASTSAEFIVASRAPMGKRDDRLKMSLLQCRKEDLPPSLDPSEHSTPAKFATSQTAREVSTRAIPQAKEMKAASMQVQFLPLNSSKSTICVVNKGKVEDKRQAKLITVTMREWYCFWNDLKTETRPARIGSELNVFSQRMGQSQNTKRGDWALQQNSGVKLIDWANLSAFGSKPNLPMYLKQGTRTHSKELQRTMLLTTSVSIEEDGIAVSKVYFSSDCELQHRYAYKIFGRWEQGHGSTNKLNIEAFTASLGHLGTGQEQDSILGLLIDPGGHIMRMGGGSRRTVVAKDKYLGDLFYIVILWSIEYGGKFEFLVQRVDNEVYKPCGYFPAEFKYQLFSNIGNHDDESIVTATIARKWGDYAICIQDMAKVMTMTKMKDRNQQSSHIILLLCHLDHTRVPLIIWHSLDPYIQVFTTVEGDAMLKVGHAQIRRWAQEVEFWTVHEKGLDSAELAAGFHSLGCQSVVFYIWVWKQVHNWKHQHMCESRNFFQFGSHGGLFSADSSNDLLESLLACYGHKPFNSFILGFAFEDAATVLFQPVLLMADSVA